VGKFARSGDTPRVVLTNGSDRPGGNLHARPFHETLINGVAERDIGIAGAFVLNELL
jgi:hypothetical protein